MITLHARGTPRNITEEVVGKISLAPLPADQRQDRIRVLSGDLDEPLNGYLAVISADDLPDTTIPSIVCCATNHLDTDDVVSLSSQGAIRTLYRKASPNNALFTTERCNSLCLMCSQPPREVDDSNRAQELINLVRLIDPSTQELGITGGEPTLLGQGLLDVIAGCRDLLPHTALHLLSNGRRFYYWTYARALGALRHPNLMVGVPVYSDLDTHHDYIVQAKGSFAETILGLHNLARAEVPVEIRIVVHRETYKRLPALAAYIYRNLTFASHVTFMGLEVIGLATANIRTLWIDPLDYANQLEEAVTFLASVGMNVSIYNHQLCTLPQTLWPYSRRSISDWKNEYAPACTPCSAKTACAGFFAWNLNGYQSRGIAPLTT
jgi:His-Xaa-Ser system radical SAM maturase HxsC